MKTTATNRKLNAILVAIRDETLIPRPEFQRRLVWSNKHKLNFIDTVLKGLPFPEVYVAAGDLDVDTGNGNELLVDGQQRITTLYQYFTESDLLKLDKRMKPYSKLSPQEKNKFLGYDVVVRDLGNQDISAIKEIFERINSTKYALNAVELHNARYDGAFKKYAEALSENKFFETHEVFNANDAKRMLDVRFALELVTTLMSTYFSQDDEVEAYLKKYNDEFKNAKALNKEIEEVFKVIEKLQFDSECRVWNKIDLFTLIVEVHRVIYKESMKISLIKCKKLLTKFYSAVSAKGEESKRTSDLNRYITASIQATSHRKSRIERGDVIHNILVSCSS